MLVAVGYVYEFQFRLTLNTLDGIYQVNSIMSYAEMLNLDLDLYALTYQPNNLSDDIFNNDLDLIRTEKIMKLTSVVDETIIYYIPEHLFAKIPDGSVQKYFRLGIAVDLGIFADAEQLSVLRSEVEQVVASMIGSTNKTVVYTVDNKWMTTSEYTVIDTARKAAITRVSNHFTDKLELIKQVDSLKVLIKYYEDALKA